MTQQEIMEKIDSLEKEKFNLEMKDFWRQSDFSRGYAIDRELLELKAMLK